MYGRHYSCHCFASRRGYRVILSSEGDSTPDGSCGRPGPRLRAGFFPVFIVQFQHEGDGLARPLRSTQNRASGVLDSHQETVHEPRTTHAVVFDDYDGLWVVVVQICIKQAWCPRL